MICALTVVAERGGIDVKIPPFSRMLKATLATEAISLIGIYLIVRVNQLFV